MRRIADWIRRLHRLTPQDGVRVHFYRAVVPSYYEFDLHDSVISFESMAALPRRPSDSAAYSSALLRFPDDTEDNHADAQALARELGAFLTLVFGRRVDVATELALSDGAKIHFLGYSAAVDRSLIGPLPENLRPKFDEAMSRVASLSAADLEILDAACRLHYASALLCERDIASAYVLLVAALEVLSRGYGDSPRAWEDWPEASSWDREFERVSLSEVQSTALREKMLASQNLRLRLTFQRYIAEHLPKSFWQQPWEEWSYGFDLHGNRWQEPTVEHKLTETIIPEDRVALAKALGKSYDLRSGIVHRGADLQLHHTALRSQVPMSPREPVPYCVLRAMLAELVKHECHSRSNMEALPKFTIPK